MIARRETRPVRVGSLWIGGDSEIVVQSMTTTRPSDREASLAQIRALAQAGCRLVRLAVPSRADALALADLRAALISAGIDLPLVADVHFNPDIALEAARHVEKVRINPGNFADDPDAARERMAPLLARLRDRGAALRIGVNHGSLPAFLADRHGHGPAAMVEAALLYLRICRDAGFDQVVVSLKASNPVTMIAANRLLADRLAREGFETPIHLGVTEAGAGTEGVLRSAVGIGSLLIDGIGDTLRVSLAGDPTTEIPVCRAILAAVREARETPAPPSLAPRPNARQAPPIPPEPGARHAPRVEIALGAGRGDSPPRERGGNAASGALPPAPDALLLRPGRGDLAPPDGSQRGDTAPPADLRESVRQACARRGLPWNAQCELWLDWRAMPRSEDAERLRAWHRAGIAGVSFAVPRETLRAALSPGAGPPDALPREEVVAGLASAADLRVRWHLDLDRASPGPEAAVSLGALADLAAALSGWTRAAGLPAPDFSWRGRPLRSAGLALQRAREVEPERCPGARRSALIAHLPADATEAAITAGALLLDGIADGIVIEEDAVAPLEGLVFADELLQAARRRLTHAEFIACPGCGRLHFDLPSALARLKARFGHIAGVRIAVMGCVVNGPGEMADADFGYVGAGDERVDLYAGSRAVRRGLTPPEAEEALAELIARRSPAV